MKTNVFELLFLGDFFSSPKRKSRRISVVLLSILLLAACQPTPEVDPVTNKAEGRLEQLIVAAPEESAAPERTVRERVGAPEAVQEDLTGHVYGGLLTVHIDARVEVPEVSRVPVYTVRFRTFSTEEKEALTKKLLGDGPYFDGNRDRAIYANCDNMVRLYEAWLKALDEGCYGPGQQENYDFHRNCNLMEYLSFEMKDMQRHSDFPAPQPWTGRFDDERFGVQNGMAQGISVTPWERGVDFSYGTDGDVSFQSSPGRQPKTDREREMWAMVEDFANSLGFTEARTDLMCGVDDDIRSELFHSDLPRQLHLYRPRRGEGAGDPRALRAGAAPGEHHRQRGEGGADQLLLAEPLGDRLDRQRERAAAALLPGHGYLPGPDLPQRLPGHLRRGPSPVGGRAAHDGGVDRPQHPLLLHAGEEGRFPGLLAPARVGFRRHFDRQRRGRQHRKSQRGVLKKDGIAVLFVMFAAQVMQHLRCRDVASQ